MSRELARGHAAVRARPTSSSCTSPLVGRRDSLGVGLRPECGVCRVAGKTARGKPSVARPAARRYSQGIRPRELYHRVKPVASARHGTRRYGPSAVPGPGPLLADGDPLTGLNRGRAVPRAPLPSIPVGDATALGTLRTRLETRTKESNMCASHWD